MDEKKAVVMVLLAVILCGIILGAIGIYQEHKTQRLAIEKGYMKASKYIKITR